jgi:hypothetical protein
MYHNFVATNRPPSLPEFWRSVSARRDGRGCLGCGPEDGAHHKKKGERMAAVTGEVTDASPVQPLPRRSCRRLTTHDAAPPQYWRLSAPLDAWRGSYVSADAKKRPQRGMRRPETRHQRRDDLSRQPEPRRETSRNGGRLIPACQRGRWRCANYPAEGPCESQLWTMGPKGRREAAGPSRWLGHAAVPASADEVS